MDRPPTVPPLQPGEPYSVAPGMGIYTTDDPAQAGMYWHWGCSDPLNLGADGPIWWDDIGNLTCQDCGMFVPAPGADADGVVRSA